MIEKRLRNRVMMALLFLFVIVAIVLVITVIGLAEEVEMTAGEKIQKLIVGAWTWEGKTSSKDLVIIFEFSPNGKLGFNRNKESKSIFYPPETVKKILRETLDSDKFSYEIKDKKIRIYLSSGEEVWGEIISISSTILKMKIKIGESDFLFVLRKLD